MSEALLIKSKIKDYELRFVNDFIVPLGDQAGKNCFFIIDEKVWELYGRRLKSLLPEGRVFTVQATEFNKTLDYCQKIIKELIKGNIRKNDNLIAIGGGVIQDITAFISSILFRGTNWIFYPTTLLAQADSCIGGKTSINFDNYKNLLGNFCPPSQIYIDVNFLETLSREAIKSGIGEMLHFFLIAGNDLAKKMMDEYEGFLSSPQSLTNYILASLKVKESVIERDEFDENERKLFNYGHTFGHAIETVSEYKIYHGQAVTMGMDIANYISHNLGYMNEQTFGSMRKILIKNMPDFCVSEDNIDHYLKALSKDKKNIGSDLVCILSRGPGAMQKTQIPLDNKLKEIILSYFIK